MEFTVSIYMCLIPVSTRRAWVCTAFCPTQFFTVCGSWPISIPCISPERLNAHMFLPSIQSFPFTSMWCCWSLPSGNRIYGANWQEHQHFLSWQEDATLHWFFNKGRCGCDNIHSWLSLTSDLTFSQQHGIYIFQYPKSLLEISSRDLLFSLFSQS